MRRALARATLYRQLFQVSGPSPLAARSRFMSACCVELTTIAGAAGPEGVAPVEAGGGGGGGGGGVPILWGIARWTTLARSVPTDAGCAACSREAVRTGWAASSRCTTEIPAPPSAATITNPPSQVKTRIAGGRV